MKRMISCILALLLLCSSALAAVPDISGCTDEELASLIDLARNRLYRNALKLEKDAVLIDQGGVLLYSTGKYTLSSYGDSCSLSLHCVLVNSTSFEVSVSCRDCSANGWEIFAMGGGCQAGKKKKVDLYFSLTEADITKLEELEDLTFTLQAYNMDTYDTLFNVGPVTLTQESLARD